MKFLFPIPRELRQADGKKRQRWLLCEESPDLPKVIYIPLEQRLEATARTELPDSYGGTPVAVYKDIGSRGKYRDYQYCGDDTK